MRQRTAVSGSGLASSNSSRGAEAVSQIKALNRTLSFFLIAFGLLQNVTSELKKHAAEAIRLEGLVLRLPSDADAKNFTVHLAGIRTRIATLLSQAESGTGAVTVSSLSFRDHFS